MGLFLGIKIFELCCVLHKHVGWVTQSTVNSTVTQIRNVAKGEKKETKQMI